MIIKISNESYLKDSLNLVWNVFEEFEAHEYSKEGVTEFKNFIDYNSILEKVQNNSFNIWGYFKDSNLLGIIATRNTNHIALFFVDKEYQG